jgi:hypothetical protein
MRIVIWKYGPWLLGWAIITILAAWLHVHVWLPDVERGDAQPMAMEGFFKRLENFVQMCVLPAWILIWRFFGRFHSFENRSCSKRDRVGNVDDHRDVDRPHRPCGIDAEGCCTQDKAGP